MRHNESETQLATANYVFTFALRFFPNVQRWKQIDQQFVRKRVKSLDCQVDSSSQFNQNPQKNEETEKKGERNFQNENPRMSFWRQYLLWNLQDLEQWLSKEIEFSLRF